MQTVDTKIQKYCTFCGTPLNFANISTNPNYIYKPHCNACVCSFEVAENHDKDELLVAKIAHALNDISNEFKRKNKTTIGCGEVFALCDQRVEDLWFRIENIIITWGTDMHWLLRQHGYDVIVDYIPIKDCEQFGLCWRTIRVADTKSNFEMVFVDNTPMRKP